MKVNVCLDTRHDWVESSERTSRYQAASVGPIRRGRERLLDMSTVWVPVLKHENGGNYPAYKAITDRSGV